MRNKSIAVIKQLFKQKEISETMIEELKQDERKGVQRLIRSYEKNKEKEKQLYLHYKKMQHFEHKAMEQGRNYIAGVDEAGRGPLAGPVVAAAVILPQDFLLLGLNDSKQLKVEERNRFFHMIKEQAIAYHIAVVSNEVIDSINILEATKRAMLESIDGLRQKPDYVLLDAGALPRLSIPSDVIKKGDERSISIAAASILAKVTRDRLMNEIHHEFPNYGFNSNMGYGTKEHMNNLRSYGASPYHRKSFAPVQKVIGQ